MNDIYFRTENKPSLMLLLRSCGLVRRGARTRTLVVASVVGLKLKLSERPGDKHIMVRSR
jgi:hypothetical protein